MMKREIIAFHSFGIESGMSLQGLSNCLYLHCVCVYVHSGVKKLG